MLHFTRRSIWFPLALVLWNRLIIQKVAAIQPLEFQADLSDLLRLVKQSNCLKTLVSLNSVYGDEELSKISNIVDTLYSSVESSNQSSTGESAEAKLFYQKRNLAAVSLMFHQVCDDVIDVDQIQEILDLQFTSTSQSVDDNFPAHQSAMEFFKSDLKPQNMKSYLNKSFEKLLLKIISNNMNASLDIFQFLLGFCFTRLRQKLDIQYKANI
ncbi:MAG: hypothetical protein MHMPM18_002633 [Marteilia pararefringens]